MMTRCLRGIAVDCADLDVRPTLLVLRRTPTPVCANCRAHMAARGIAFTVVADPVSPPPAIAPTWRPRWLANLSARDETGRLVA